jgi:hypothetical protein
MRSVCRAFLATGVIVCLGSCGDESTAPTSDAVSAYLQGLPSWTEFCPPTASVAPKPSGEAPKTSEETVDVNQIDESGNVDLLPKVTYACTSTPYTMTDTPEKIVMYSPDTEVMYPGALIQGKSHRDGLGSLLPLTIAERAKIKVSIPALKNTDNFRLTQPTQADVGQAIGNMIGKATTDKLVTPSTIAFDMRSYHSEKQTALSMKMSAKYLGFSMSASGDFSRNASETTVTAQFYQKMFEVVVEPPQTPGAFFSEDFTVETLDAQEKLGKIGDDNIPVYVSNVVYGRMMMFSLTSTASEQEIRATLNAAYSGIAFSGSASLSAKHKSILKESKIAVASVGGDAQATIAMIRSGDWSQYFTKDAPLSSAAPLSYTMRNLGDGSIATVGETTKYNITTCNVKAAEETFHLLPLVEDKAPAIAPGEMVVADVDGDGKDDLVWNYRDANKNELYVGLSQGDGTFTFGKAQTHVPNAQGGWGNYTPLVADVDGDGKQDLVWTLLMAGQPIRTYVGLSTGSGFDLSTPYQDVTDTNGVTPAGSSSHRVVTGDIDGDGQADLLWVDPTGSTCKVWVGRGQDTGKLFIATAPQQHTSGCLDQTFHAGDFNGDGWTDLYTSHLQTDTYNRSVRFLSKGDGTFSMPSGYLQHPTQKGWAAYAAHAGDFDGDGHADLLWNALGQDNLVYVGLGRIDGSLSYLAQQAHPDGGESSTTDFTGYKTLVADINGDGRDDLVWNLADSSGNRTYYGLANGDGTFLLPQAGYQDHTAKEQWSQYKLASGDFNGDGRADLIWNHFTTTSNKIYVGLSVVE